MRRVPAYAIAIATGAAFTTANAQFSVANPTPSKITVTSANGGTSGGFLGSDACTSAHTPAGSGSVSGVPFTTGTTGTQGQNEAICLAFGSTAINNDVWYDWTSTSTGNAVLSTCAGTSVDTKVAAYPFSGASSCPANGTSLACNDDACGLQTSTAWAVTAGSTYTIQLGTFPGAAGGSGTFDITQAAPLPCGEYDDGTTENALGLTAGGEIGWLHGFDCLLTVDRVETAYGTPLGPAPANGSPARIVVYEDADCDDSPATPAGGMTLEFSLATTVTNAATDILNNYPVAPIAQIQSRCSWVMATASHPAGTFPAPMDQTAPTPMAWVSGQTTGPNSMDINNLNNNATGTLQMQAIGFPAAFLLRASGTESGGTPSYPQVCFGGSGCPCGNNGDGQGGCQHTVGTGGTILAGSGNASLGADTFVLTATRTRNAPGIFFQANNTLGSPPAFGDGLRCCGVNVVRIGTYLAAGNTTNTDTGNQIGGVGPPVSDHPGNASLAAGQTKCYQYWHRDPATGVCGNGFNLSNAVQATWTL